LFSSLNCLKLLSISGSNDTNSSFFDLYIQWKDRTRKGKMKYLIKRQKKHSLFPSNGAKKLDGN
jgi:hypothetical protein